MAASRQAKLQFGLIRPTTNAIKGDFQPVSFLKVANTNLTEFFGDDFASITTVIMVNESREV